MSQDSLENNYGIYCLNYLGSEIGHKRRAALEQRFNQLQLHCNFCKGVSHNDIRLVNANDKKSASCMMGHIDMIATFIYNSNHEFGIFCEDDVLIRSDIKKHIPSLQQLFKKSSLDVMLLGYLLPYNMSNSDAISHHSSQQLPYIDSIMSDGVKISLHGYHDELWGAQMYMLSRNAAKILHSQYSSQSPSSQNPQSPQASQTTPPYAADFTITKYGKRGLVTPIMAIENNDGIYEHFGQNKFHRACYAENINEWFTTSPKSSTYSS